jgi:hypothetical protein
MFRTAARRPLPLALALVLALTPLAAAQESELPSAEEARDVVRTASGLELSADLQPSYLAGHELVVTLRVENPQSTSLEFPRLDVRPYLVTFDLEGPDGRKQHRSNTPPEEEDEDLWVLPPRASRQVSLQLPSAATLRPGRYQLGFTVDAESEELVLEPRPILLDPPAPVLADFVSEPELSHRAGWQTPWVHQGAQGTALYLHSAPASHPGARGYHWHLASLDEPAQPWLSTGRVTEAWSRYLYWLGGERSLFYARLGDRGLRGEPREIALPWPRWELLARGGSDAGGGLHLPVWVPAPSGEAGEVRVVSIQPHEQPRFRRVVAMDAKPEASTLVDAAGHLRLLLLHDGKLDLYTVGPNADEALPIAGRRLLPRPLRAGEPQLLAPAPASSAAGSGLVAGRIRGFVSQRLAALEPPPLMGVRFGRLPEEEDEAGGVAVFGWLADPAAERAVVHGVWMSTAGRVIATVPGALLPPGHRIAQVLPRGYEPMVLVSLDRRGEGWAHCAAWDAPVSLGRFEGGALREDAEGRLWLSRLVAGQGVVSQPISP